MITKLVLLMMLICSGGGDNNHNNGNDFGSDTFNDDKAKPKKKNSLSLLLFLPFATYSTHQGKQFPRGRE